MAKIGLQLYTIRDVAEKDFLGTIRKVGQMGYDGVEFAGGAMQAAPLADLQRTLAESNLEVAGAVFGIEEMESNLDGLLAFCQAIGCPTVVSPWIDEKLRQTAADYRAVAHRLNGYGKRLQQAGVQLLHHVHGFEFATLDGKTGMELLMEEFDPLYVNLEIDVYWVEHAGVDSVAFTQKYASRTPSIHFKDMKDRQSKMDVEVGGGYIDMRAIARIGKQHHAAWFIVEQEQFERPTLESAAISLRNLRKIAAEA
jgi:sugar phosphate isomerase/epimerase